MIHFLDAPVGPPTAWVPPCVSPSSIPPSSELELPSRKERGRCSGIGISEQVQVYELEPTSLKRGEGLIAEFQCLVEAEMGGEGEDGGIGMGGE